MNLLRPFKCTLSSNVNENSEIIDENLIGHAVQGWIEMRSVEVEGKTELVPVPMFCVMWEGRVLKPAVSVYENSEIYNLGEFSDIEDALEYEDDEDDADDEYYEEETAY